MTTDLPDYRLAAKLHWHQQGMTDDWFAAMDMFVPHTVLRIGELVHEGAWLAHYTNADTAVKLLRNGEFWLRNALTMNDPSEIRYGFSLLDDAHGKVQITLNKLAVDLFGATLDEVTKGYHTLIQNTYTKTFIGCLSEFSEKLDPESLGRLSMWRAYGGDCGVALIINPNPIVQATSRMAVRTFPVRYSESVNVLKDYRDLIDRLEANRDVIKRNGAPQFASMLQFFFDTIVLGSKHKGFEEEREWRLVYRADSQARHLKPPKLDVETIRGIPQVVQKIELKNGITGSGGTFLFDQLIHRVIVGPCDQSILINDALFVTLMMNGFSNPELRVKQSAIPLRRAW